MTLLVKEYNAIKHQTIFVGANSQLSICDAYRVANQMSHVEVAENSLPAINRSFQFLQVCLNQRMPIYGVNTHFGDQVGLLDWHIKNANADLYYESIHARQENLLRSHSCGLGTPVSPAVIRVAMCLRAHCLSQGYSGVNLSVIQALLAFVNADITPIVRTYGSIGASGDLIPLAMIAAAVIGENVAVNYRGEIMQAPEALQLAKLSPVTLKMRDGLAMINGTSFMTAIASLAVYQLNRLFKQMLTAIAMSLESLFVITSGYNPLVHQLKRHLGENAINNFLIDFWQGSQLLTDLDELRQVNLEGSDANNHKPVQDFYSVRSVSQGFGTFHENLHRSIEWIENEINSVNDNPIVDVAKKKIYHCANFMGYYVTSSCDILKTDIAQASTWIHALLANLVHPRKNHHLPANLVPKPDQQNGFRPLQILAASLAVQNRKLAQSHAAYMLPTEGDNQDVNSLGTHAAFDLQESVNNLERLVAILLLAATQALEFRGIDKASPKSQAIYHILRQHSSKVADCRPMSDEISMIIELLANEKI